MRRKRIGTVGFDQKIVQDVGLAALAVRILPIVVNNFFPLNQNLFVVVGTGTGYLAGTLLKNKTLANASIALGLVEFIAPAVENIVGGFGMGGGGSNIPAVLPKGKMTVGPTVPLSDYINLNDYTNDPSRRLSVSDYRDFY